jgi:hypothetical protein
MTSLMWGEPQWLRGAWRPSPRATHSRTYYAQPHWSRTAEGLTPERSECSAAGGPDAKTSDGADRQDWPQAA